MMEYQILILSSDAIFARMLELELLMQGYQTAVMETFSNGVYADTVLLDLDSAHAPPLDSYRRMIGFTKHSALTADDARRRCSMILHRPFEMRLLRCEISQQDSEKSGILLPTSHDHLHGSPLLRTIYLQDEKSLLVLDGRHISLSPKEFLVMQCLLAHRGSPVSREMLSKCIGESEGNKTDVYICLLRRKTEDGSGNRLIYTIRGKGYLIRN